MRTFLVVALAILGSGCASSPTPQSFQEGSPEAVYVSEKAPQQVAECIISKWENVRVLGGRYSTSYRPTPNGIRITLGESDRLRYMADIEKVTLGSKTKIYVDYMVVSIGKNPQVSEAANCQ
jgi:hypothetical protein